jgi:hypothetical protein
VTDDEITDLGQPDSPGGRGFMMTTTTAYYPIVLETETSGAVSASAR